MSTRLPPTVSTLRTLYAHSGNQCANPDCSTILINANGSFLAEVCHIKAAKKGGPRFDPALTPDQRRQVSNLILLCRTCHALVDSEPRRYTVKTLTQWKRDREDQFKAVGQTLRQRYLADISDDADTIGATAPRSLSRYITFLEQDSRHHELDDPDTLSDTLAELADYVDRVRHLSLDDRQLLVAVIAKALVLDQTSPFTSGLGVHPDDLRTIRIANKNLSLYRIGQLAETLDRHNLGWLDPDEPLFRISDPADRVPWIELADFLESHPPGLRRLLIDLDFTFLDLP